MMRMNQPRILSGIQPTGKLHIGNYLGALKNFVELQNSNKYECFFMIADYHSITEDYDPATKPQQIMDLMIDYLAVGLDPEKSVLFAQSQIPEHTELAWIFNTITPIGELSRMTQFKDKSTRQEKNINAGLLTYPTLMAADILLYNTAPEVPIGDDQTQHLELARLIARKFNTRFGKTFIEPKGLYTQTPRIMSLTNPDKKMSKSDPAGCLFISDDAQIIEKKLARAVTDTGKSKTMSAGTQNLFKLLEIFGGSEQFTFYREAHEKRSIKYSELKTNLAKIIAHHFSDYRKKRLEFDKNPEQIKNVISQGKIKAQAIARETLQVVKQKIGLQI